MGTVIFRFDGICVNFRGEEVHRVLLQNLDRDWLIDGHFIPPHRARMTVNAGDLAQEVRLAGCGIRFPSLLGETLQQDTLCIPNLTELMRERGVTLGPPSRARVEGDDPRLIACRFEFPFGLITGITIRQAANTVVTITTPGDLTMDLVPFPTSDMPPRQFVLPDDSRVFVTNTADPEQEHEDSQFHFLLSYLTAETFPADPVLPTSQDITCPIEALHDWTAGASCSNSNYP